MADYFKKVISGAFIIFAANVLASIFSYAMRLVMTSNITPIDYGMFYACFSLVSIVLIFSDFGLTHSLIYHISKFNSEGKVSELRRSILTTFTLQTIFGIAFAAVLYFSSNLIIATYLHLPLENETAQSAILVIRILAVGVFLNVFMNMIGAIFQGFQDMRMAALLEFSRIFLWFAATTVFIYMHFSAISPALGFITGYALVALIFGWIAFRRIPKDGASKDNLLDGKIAKDLFTYGFPIMISLAIGYIISYTDTILISFFRTLEEVSLYQTAQPIAAILWLFSGSLVVVLFPLIAEAKTNNMKAVEEGMAFIYRYIWLVIIPASFIAFSFSTEILMVLFGPAYIGGVVVLKILSIGAIFFSITQINGTVLNSLGHPDNYKNVVYLGAAVNVIGNLLLVPPYGIDGAAAATLVSYLIMLIGSFWELRKFTKIKIPFEGWAKTVLAGLIGVGAIYLTKTMISVSTIVKIALGLSVFGIVFVSLILLMGVVNLREIYSLIRIGIKK